MDEKHKIDAQICQGVISTVKQLNKPQTKISKEDRPEEDVMVCVCVCNDIF